MVGGNRGSFAPAPSERQVPLRPVQLVAFVVIWWALGLSTWDAFAKR